MNFKITCVEICSQSWIKSASRSEHMGSRLDPILGDPGAVSRVGRKGETKVFKYRRKSTNFCRTLSPYTTDCPWVSEDDLTLVITLGVIFQVFSEPKAQYYVGWQVQWLNERHIVPQSWSSTIFDNFRKWKGVTWFVSSVMIIFSGWARPLLPHLLFLASRCWRTKVNKKNHYYFKIFRRFWLTPFPGLFFILCQLALTIFGRCKQYTIVLMVY